MSYLELAKRVEACHLGYRAELLRWWADPDATRRPPESVVRLLDELGVTVAARVYGDAAERWDRAAG